MAPSALFFPLSNAGPHCRSAVFFNENKYKKSKENMESHSVWAIGVVVGGEQGS